ncbi:MAG: hypothetical protein U9R36_01320, partial [Elusimicrobiota bacterium]|nr:hypothetical protein [Elusimicrobiota bacterium]
PLNDQGRGQRPRLQGNRFAGNFYRVYRMFTIKQLNNVFAYAGVDAHREDRVHDLYLKMELEKLEEGAILAEFKAGRYSLNFARFKIPATAELSLRQKIIFPGLLTVYRGVDKLVDFF